ncbi:unnamed protein product [Ectocarpus sp. CCAP 1310/34]|nr:unnamed protein product [Ectocarpus sp. CCAP 1310/34]
MVPSKMRSWSSLLAVLLSISLSQGFILSPAGLRASVHAPAGVRSNRASSCFRGGKHSNCGISMQDAATAEEDSVAAKGELAWAESQFPGCSTVLSKATRLSGLLADVWETLADPSAVEAERPRVLMFPDCPAVAEARGLQNLYEHLEVCQDACEQFGTMVSIVPHPRGGKNGAPAPSLVVQVVPGAGGGDDFGYDPDWDDDWDIDRSLLDDDEAEGEGAAGGDWDEDGVVRVDAAALGVVPSSDEEVQELTKSWVQAVITDMGVCPFSVDASRAGLPVGQIRYPVTRETTAESIYREYWREVELLVSETNERSLSTTLLITPDFSLNNAEAFEVIGQTLTQPLEALHLEDDIQLVFFHPQYAFRDGRDRIGSGGAANFARRSPFPMINILRTNQVRLAQKSIPTGLVYKQNEEVLEEVGAGDLQKMLEVRDWTGLEGKKVDRRRVEYYQTARKLQGEDVTPSTKPLTSSEADADPTPAPPTDSRAGGGGTAAAAAVNARSGARGSLATAAGTMQTSFEEGFSSHDEDDGDDVDDDGSNEVEPAVETAAEVEVESVPSAGSDGPPEVATAGATSGDDVAAAAGAAADSATTSRVGGAAATAAAASSAGISDEDLKTVASALVKRLGTGKPLQPAAFDEFSDAVDRVLESTAGAR